MATVVRDRTARSRIRSYLAQNGPIEDPSGGATALLKEAIHYSGSAVAFIQLVTSMAKDQDIERDIRGKRTYGISLARGAAQVEKVPGQPLQTGSVEHIPTIDYEKLAREIVREAVRLVALVGSNQLADVATVKGERDLYARQLQVARQQLDALLGISRGADNAEADDYVTRTVG